MGAEAISNSFPQMLEKSRTVRWLLDHVDERAEQVVGDKDISFGSVATPENATADSFVFIQADGDAARKLLSSCAAAVVVVKEALQEEETRCFVVARDPRRWYASALASLFPSRESGIHETAVIGHGVKIGKETSIGPHCVIGDGAVIGDRTNIFGLVYVAGRSSIGHNCRIQASTTVGGIGIMNREDSDGWLDFPHVGRVAIGDNVRIGSNSAIMAGMLGNTVIEDNCVIGNCVNIGHECRIGEQSWIASGAVIAGLTVLEANVFISPGAILRDRLRIGERATIGTGSVVTKDVSAGAKMFGVPACKLPTLKARPPKMG